MRIFIFSLIALLTYTSNSYADVLASDTKNNPFIKTGAIIMPHDYKYTKYWIHDTTYTSTDTIVHNINVDSIFKRLLTDPNFKIDTHFINTAYLRNMYYKKNKDLIVITKNSYGRIFLKRLIIDRNGQARLEKYKEKRIQELYDND